MHDEALLAAVAAGDEVGVQQALAAGADPRARRAHTVQVLLTAGADPAAEDSEGLLAAHWARVAGKESNALLLERAMDERRRG